MCRPSSDTALASGLGSPEDIAVDGSYVYWTDPPRGTVSRTLKQGGGATEVLATGESGPFRLSVDGTHVYWTAKLGGAIRRAPKAGGPSEVFAVAGQPWGIAIDDNSAYWTEGGDGQFDSGSVRAADKITKMTRTVVAAASPRELVADETALYYVNEAPQLFAQTWVSRVGKDGTQGGVVHITERRQALALAVDCDYLYTFDGLTGPRIARVRKADILDQSPDHAVTMTSRSIFFPSLADMSLAVDGTSIYWGALYRQSKSTGFARRLFLDQVPVHRVTADDAYLYWTSGSTIRRIRKDGTL